jgi:hypothetical protein
MHSFSLCQARVKTPSKQNLQVFYIRGVKTVNLLKLSKQEKLSKHSPDAVFSLLNSLKSCFCFSVFQFFTPPGNFCFRRQNHER